jgi:hypothetical protein
MNEIETMTQNLHCKLHGRREGHVIKDHKQGNVFTAYAQKHTD